MDRSSRSGQVRRPGGSHAAVKLQSCGSASSCQDHRAFPETGNMVSNLPVKPLESCQPVKFFDPHAFVFLLLWFVKWLKSQRSVAEPG